MTNGERVILFSQALIMEFEKREKDLRFQKLFKNTLIITRLNTSQQFIE
jgi:hypothetical protein